MDHKVSATQLASYQVAALQQLPIAVILFIPEHGIQYVNNACETLFGAGVVKLGASISDLPLNWRTVTEQVPDELLSSLPTQQDNGSVTEHSIYPVTLLPPAVSAQSTACVRVTRLDQCNASVRIITIDNVRLYNHESEHQSRKPSAAIHANILKLSQESDGPTLSRKSSHDSLNEQFQKMRDAIYFNDDASGFLLSADETFCFPSFTGATDVEPVRLRKGAADFVESYHLWDSEFREELDLSAYPARRLNVERKVFKDYRIGIRLEGKELIMSCNGQPLYDKDTNEYIGGVVWVRTLGERDDVMMADMKTDLSAYQSICERLPHVLWTMTPEGSVDYFSSCWFEFTGIDQNEPLSTGFEKVVHQDDISKIWQIVQNCAEKKIEIQTEVRCRRVDGAWIWHVIAGKPLLDKHGKLLKWYGTLTEIQSLVSAREDADKKKSQMQDMLSLADISLFHIDAQAKLVMLEGKSHWTPQQLANLDDVQPFGRYVRQVLTGHLHVADFEYELDSKWYKCRLVGNDEDGSLLGCSVDITDQRQKAILVVENSRLVSERAVALEKSRLKDEFLAHMSHEIRTPIAGVIGMAHMLEESKLSTGDSATLQDIIQSAQNLLVIVNDILDLSKIESGKMTVENRLVHVADLVEQTGRSFQHAIRSKPVTLKYGSPKLSIIGDPTKIGQILTNLLSNALKFTSQGSVVLFVETKGQDIAFTVTDTGIGIDQITLRKLFNPFVQGDSSTARRYGGTGLGLAICRSLAEIMGGSLNIVSEKGKGSTATLLLPRNTRPELVSARTSDCDFHEAPTPNMAAEDLVILVVEDNLVNQKFALHLVKKHGYRGVAVIDGQKALDYLTDKPGNVALILMDCQMPRLDGYVTTREIRSNELYKAFKELPIVALTASAITGDEEKCYTAGMDDYLTKPVNFKDFQRVVGRWLPGRVFKAAFKKDG